MKVTTGGSRGGLKITQGNLLLGSKEQTKVQPPPIQLVAEYKPDTERCLRGLMLVLGVDREEIERSLAERRGRLDHGDEVAH